MASFAAVSRPYQDGVPLYPQQAQKQSQAAVPDNVKALNLNRLIDPTASTSTVASSLVSSRNSATSASSRNGQPGPEPRISSLHDQFDRIKGVGDGSFGCVVRAVERRSQRSSRPSTYYAIKIIKKEFSSLRECNQLREIIFLRTLPPHPNLVPALDIFLDQSSRQLHIVMEFMDCNLYQLMKSRDGHPFPHESVKSVLRQIMTGLQHIHANQFFHRDIKPENILVSPTRSEQHVTQLDHRRHSTALATPPATPPTYTIKLADFGLAREIGSSSSYTTYVSTRWYRAPEVLFHARRYSAPVDIWAVGAMAAEIATLKPLFPGSSEVDQVYRICAIRGSPDGLLPSSARSQRTSVIGRHILPSAPAAPTGGGEWHAGVELAHKVGVKLYRMVPRPLPELLGNTFPKEFYDFLDWCLKWDPEHRPTSDEALQHFYFTGVPPTVQQSRLSNRRTMDNLSSLSQSSRTSWFKRTLGVSSNSTAEPKLDVLSERNPNVEKRVPEQKEKTSRRTTWASSIMNIAGSGRSPVTQATTTDHTSGTPKSKLVHQPSVLSNRPSVTEMHRLEAERALNGQVSAAATPSTYSPVVMSPPANQRESFFSHLRKRARRMSGRPSLPLSPEETEGEDGGVSVGCSPWASNSNRNSVVLPQFGDGIGVQRNSQVSINSTAPRESQAQAPPKPKQLHRISATSLLLRRKSHRQGQPNIGSPGLTASFSNSETPLPSVPASPHINMASSFSGRTGRQLAMAALSPKYDIPNEADEYRMSRATSVRLPHPSQQVQGRGIQQQEMRNGPAVQVNTSNIGSYSHISHNYPTPSHSATGSSNAPSWASNCSSPAMNNLKPANEMQLGSQYNLSQQAGSVQMLSPVSPALSSENYKGYSYNMVPVGYGSHERIKASGMGGRAGRGLAGGDGISHQNGHNSEPLVESLWHRNGR